MSLDVKLKEQWKDWGATYELLAEARIKDGRIIQASITHDMSKVPFHEIDDRVKVLRRETRKAFKAELPLILSRLDPA